MFKKRVGLVLALCLGLSVLLVFATGCGGGDDVIDEATGNGEEESEVDSEKEIIKLRIGSGHDTHITWVGAVDEFFIPEVDKRLEDTNYKIEWTKAFGGTVAGLGEVLDAVEAELLDIGVVVSVFEPSDLAVHNFNYHVPFSVPDVIYYG
ncbi:MAG: hypothetical protein ACOYBM_04350 [Dethiobacteria bacterium]